MQHVRPQHHREALGQEARGAPCDHGERGCEGDTGAQGFTPTGEAAPASQWLIAAVGAGGSVLIPQHFQSAVLWAEQAPGARDCAQVKGSRCWHE